MIICQECQKEIKANPLDGYHYKYHKECSKIVERRRAEARRRGKQAIKSPTVARTEPFMTDEQWYASDRYKQLVESARRGNERKTCLK